MSGDFGIPSLPTSFGEPGDCPQTPPLCRGLYDRLKHLARQKSDGQLIIANEGEPMSGTWEVNSHNGSPRWTVLTWGETYRINCPFCNDTRHRLWIPYMFGQPDPNNPNRMADFFGICFNDDCLRTDPSAREQLAYELFGVKNSGDIRGFQPDQLDPNRPPTEAKLIPRDWPGPCQPLSTLPANDPAVVYMNSRGFDMEHFDKYDLRLCVDCNDQKHVPAIGRIIAPITQNGVMYGWQGRFIGEPHGKRVPKYYTCPGMPKRFLLYNYDRAKHEDYNVVFEGITDVWRLSGYVECHALLGKTISPQQQQILTVTDKPIVLCLDADAWDSSAHAVQALINGRNPVVRIRLPEGWDPADYEAGALLDIIRSQSSAAGVELSL